MATPGSLRPLPRAALVAPALLAMMVTFVLPLVWLARTALTAAPASGGGLTFDAFARVWSDSFYWWVLARTALLGATVAVIAVPAAFPIALFLSRTQSRWRGLLAALAVAPLLTSTVIRTYGWMVILGRHGVINSILTASHLVGRPLRLDNGSFATILALVEILMPFAIVSLLGGLGRIDPALERTASLLGATPWVVFRRVTLPLGLSALLTSGLLVFVLAISSLVTPQLMGGGRVFLLSGEIFNETTITLDWPLAAALALTLMVLFGCVIVAYQRLMSHVEQGA